MFDSEGKKMTAEWEIVKGVVEYEKIEFVKLSKLM